MPRNALGHALGQNNIENFELLRGFNTIQGIVPGTAESTETANSVVSVTSAESLDSL